MGVLASADNPVSHGASGFCRWEKQLYYAKKHSRRVHLWLCFVFSCLLLRGLDMERQHISRSYMGYLICHHSGSLPCRYVGIPTVVVSGLTLNMAFFKLPPLSVFRDIFLRHVDCHRAIRHGGDHLTEGLCPHIAHGVNAGNAGLRGLSGHDIAALVQR